nr:MAG TPA: hypothetical protein [Caudoviricetes sp.]
MSTIVNLIKDCSLTPYRGRRVVFFLVYFANILLK